MATAKKVIKKVSKKKEVEDEEFVSKNFKRAPKRETLHNVKNLDDIMGTKVFGSFGASTEEELNKKLADMNLMDLHRLAVKVGLLPVYDKSIMKSRIRNEFHKFQKSQKRYSVTGREDIHHGLSASTEQKIKRILNGIA